jgi:hypothetical protein
MSKGMPLKDLSNADQHQQNGRIIARVIPEVARVRAEVQELREELQRVQRDTGPVLLMMIVALTQPGNRADGLLTGPMDMVRRTCMTTEKHASCSLSRPLLLQRPHLFNE